MSAPTVAPVSGGQLAVAASVGALVGALLKVVLESLAGAAPAPVGAGIILVLIAALVGAMARTATRRLRDDPLAVAPALAVRWLGIARTSLLGGAGLVAMFAFWALASLPTLASPLGRARLVWSLVAVVGAVLLGVAGWFLERALRVPDDDEDDDVAPALSDDPRRA